MAGGGVTNLKQLIKLTRTLWGRGSGHFLHVSVGQSPRFHERFILSTLSRALHPKHEHFVEQPFRLQLGETHDLLTVGQLSGFFGGTFLDLSTLALEHFILIPVPRRSTLFRWRSSTRTLCRVIAHLCLLLGGSGFLTFRRFSGCRGIYLHGISLQGCTCLLLLTFLLRGVWLRRFLRGVWLRRFLRGDLILGLPSRSSCRKPHQKLLPAIHRFKVKFRFRLVLRKPVIQRGKLKVRFDQVLHVLANKCLSLFPKVPEEGLVLSAQEVVQLLVYELTHERRFAILSK